MDGNTPVGQVPLAHLAGWETLRDGAVLRITLKTLFIQVAKDRVIAIEYDQAALIGMIKEKIAATEGIAAEEQRLMFAGRELGDDHTLLHYGIESSSTLRLVQAGGGEPRRQSGVTKGQGSALPVLIVLRTPLAREISQALLKLARGQIIGELPYGHGGRDVDPNRICHAIVRENGIFAPFTHKNEHFAKTGSGQT